VLDVPRPSAIACTFESEAWQDKGGSTLVHVEEGGKPVAHVNRAEAVVTVPVGADAESAVVEAKNGGLKIRGLIRKKQLALRPAVPFSVGPFLTMQTNTAVRWVGGSPGEIEVEVDVPTELRLGVSAQSSSIACGDLGIEPREFDAVVTAFGADRARRMWLGRAFVAIGASPDGKPEGMLRVPDATPVFAVQTEKGMTRIAWPVQGVVIVGWVKSSTLKTRNSSMRSSRTRMSSLGMGTVTPLDRRTCDEDVPLLVGIDDVMKTFGIVDEGETIDVLEIGQTHSTVAIPSTTIRPAAGARFLIRNDVLERCRLALPRPTPRVP
jgi:hypothetical protein